MAFGRLRTQNNAPNSEINMIPLIDVMLVLLVIFIITAPMVTQTVRLKLPETASIEAPKEQAVEQKPILIAINPDQKVFINEKEIAAEALSSELAALKGTLGGTQPVIQLHIDRSVPYELIAKTLTALSQAGLPNIGFVSLPEEEQ